jgi:hypothetical protein
MGAFLNALIDSYEDEYEYDDDYGYDDEEDYYE